MTIQVKICGIRDAEALAAALAAGADMVGFVRFPPSPRHVALDTARALSSSARGRALRTLLVVDATDRELDAPRRRSAPPRSGRAPASRS